MHINPGPDYDVIDDKVMMYRWETYPDDTFIGEVGMGDDIDTEESVDAVLGVQST